MCWRVWKSYRSPPWKSDGKPVLKLSEIRAEYDFIVVGAGSAGCATAAGLVEAEAGSVLLVEAGAADSGWLVRAPLGLVWLMGGRRDWNFRSTPQVHLHGRQIKIPRGRMLGGSSSINSMVWFRGRRDDFDNWDVDGWRWADVEPAFDAIEAKLNPARLLDPHPLSEGLHSLFHVNGIDPPTPEYDSAGVFHFNMRDGRRWSAADAFLRPAQQQGLHVLTKVQVDRIEFRQGRAMGVRMRDGSRLQARKGIVLSAGSIGSPEILMRSGVGPTADLETTGVKVVAASEEVGCNLQDHPTVGIHGTLGKGRDTVQHLPSYRSGPPPHSVFCFPGRGRSARLPSREGLSSTPRATGGRLMSRFTSFLS